MLKCNRSSVPFPRGSPMAGSDLPSFLLFLAAFSSFRAGGGHPLRRPRQLLIASRLDRVPGEGKQERSFPWTSFSY